ncbi:MAG: transglycosylase SLT domain-containing protein [Alphaproteobacteria bacterium]|nr:transglycosylase SLT domain-containing protein [Alphaproteobacteria bacterium]
MVTTIGSISSENTVANQSVGLTSRVASAIKQASVQSGVDFSYLMNKANQESSFNPNAKAKSSSATGLFQFIEQTWLQVIKAYGGKYGLDQVASRISVDSSGVARVSDQESRLAILNLRKDPEVSAKMAAELANENCEKLKGAVGGKIGATELYLAHFLGVNGAATFIKEMRANPNAVAADYLPTAAAANSKVFYDKEGQPRTCAQIYKQFAKKFEGNDAIMTGNIVMTADAGGATGAAANYNFASNSIARLSGLASPGSSYTPSVANSFQADETSSTYFTAMLMAQMNQDSMSVLSSSSDNTSSGIQRKRDSLSSLSLAS